ncbi:hypothetical protein OVY29_19440 [Sphingopyxis sp. SE2]|jgi:hypothetical protein|uniref:hypothetical protein n=1 Tax=unclassified Sphingopyxis TaxID=2614943 RepID=UPI00050F8DEF|nr:MULTISPECIES: hypothetical protein [unclassified Sphingopyxis]KGB53517.1 hypothetical protein FG95_03292 [Sphingopyxis sp. LC363]MDT7530840.1 hypothetical protein [Sphingopyxis sp. SE2]
MFGGLQHWIEAQHARPSAPTRAWIWTLAFGIATLLFGLHLTQVFPQTGHDIAPGYGAPVLAFEFAGSQADLEAIFGFFTDPQQVTRLAAMRTGNERDYLYMLLYAGFLVSGCIALWRELRHRALLAAAVLPVAAALCDAWENWLLFEIQAAFTLGDYSPAMASLPYPVAAKFLAIAATNVVIGAAATQFGRWWALAGTLAILAAIPTAMAIVTPAAFAWALIPSAAGGWLLLLALAATGSWQALARKRPLVDWSHTAPEPATPGAVLPTRRVFGRRRA